MMPVEDLLALAPDMFLVQEIEEEIAPIPVLLAQLAGDRWRVSDLVSLVHMMRARSGTEQDYSALGAEMMRSGMESFRTAALVFLTKVMT
ncbi:MAG: hypothetical protein OXT65_08770 [Alphaproteobacteria bacterium]|nr:hypothetical protein [Alphaproteobacteria bacterium]